MGNALARPGVLFASVGAGFMLLGVLAALTFWATQHMVEARLRDSDGERAIALADRVQLSRDTSSELEAGMRGLRMPVVAAEGSLPGPGNKAASGSQQSEAAKSASQEGREPQPAAKPAAGPLLKEGEVLTAAIPTKAPNTETPIAETPIADTPIAETNAGAGGNPAADGAGAIMGEARAFELKPAVAPREMTATPGAEPFVIKAKPPREEASAAVGADDEVVAQSESAEDAAVDVAELPAADEASEPAADDRSSIFAKAIADLEEAILSTISTESKAETAPSPPTARPAALFSLITSKDGEPTVVDAGPTPQQAAAAADAPVDPPATYRVRRSVYVRQGPGMEFPVAGQLNRGQVADFAGVGHGWLRFERPDGGLGYVFESWLEPMSETG